MEPIYLDHAATTPVHPEVIADMQSAVTDVFGNPSSIHRFGRKARHLLDEARELAASSIGANEKDIVFTSGGTESDNLALIGTALANKARGNHIITTQIEHHATLHAANYLEGKGFDVTYLQVDETGRVRLEDLKDSLKDNTVLVSIMAVNNETGVIQPIQEIGELLHHHQAYFHTDAVQAYGLLKIDVDAWNVDLLSVSSHKINGPKGVGFLYVREGVKMDNLQYGGEQERKRRPGTENLVGIRGFQKAIEISQHEREERAGKYSSYKKIFMDTLKENQISFSINGDEAHIIPNIINMSFPHTQVEALLTNFDLEGIASSSGSACTAGSVDPSHVLSAMFGSNHERTQNSVRFSFGLANTEENVKEAAVRIAKVLNRLTK
ncbi:cysteine desulfurase [Radiobacillus kanasensis]|uniref:cysteine desulfurase family protein n=1 Tax=Radiobacillus kanasensis TaxID=2844358 RepID=UPI001E5A1163|nr:cysteine desulfurase family protein [Radiobacillus kanasensis]UFT97876.1 cysteine desulfurase [Radiobacillus kanasensis]